MTAVEENVIGRSQALLLQDTQWKNRGLVTFNQAPNFWLRAIQQESQGGGLKYYDWLRAVLMKDA